MRALGSIPVWLKKQKRASWSVFPGYTGVLLRLFLGCPILSFPGEDLGAPYPPAGVFRQAGEQECTQVSL